MKLLLCVCVYVLNQHPNISKVNSLKHGIDSLCTVFNSVYVKDDSYIVFIDILVSFWIRRVEVAISLSP